MAKQWEDLGAFEAVGAVFAKAPGLKDPGVFRNLCGWLPGSEQECVNTTGSGEVCWEQHLQAFAPREVTLGSSHIHVSKAAPCAGAKSSVREPVGLGMKPASPPQLCVSTFHSSLQNRASYSIICNCKTQKPLEARRVFFHTLAEIHLTAHPGA